MTPIERYLDYPRSMSSYGPEISGFGDVWWCGGAEVRDMCGAGALEAVESGLTWPELPKVWWCGVGVHATKNNKTPAKR